MARNIIPAKDNSETPYQKINLPRFSNAKFPSLVSVAELMHQESSLVLIFFPSVFVQNEGHAQFATAFGSFYIFLQTQCVHFCCLDVLQQFIILDVQVLHQDFLK